MFLKMFEAPKAPKRSQIYAFEAPEAPKRSKISVFEATEAPKRSNIFEFGEAPKAPKRSKIYAFEAPEAPKRSRNPGDVKLLVKTDVFENRPSKHPHVFKVSRSGFAFCEGKMQL